jgi:hypothetical protein
MRTEEIEAVRQRAIRLFDEKKLDAASRVRATGLCSLADTEDIQGVDYKRDHFLELALQICESVQ